MNISNYIDMIICQHIHVCRHNVVNRGFEQTTSMQAFIHSQTTRKHFVLSLLLHGLRCNISLHDLYTYN